MWQRKIGHYPALTSKMLAILELLESALAQDYPFIAVSAHPRTLKALVNRDWIFASSGLDGVRYKITGRGMKALNAYRQQPPARRDGLCPTCGERPRKVAPSGYVYGYCEECNRAYGRKQYALKGHQVKAGRLCSRCHEHPCLVYPSGNTIAYCDECRRALRKDERVRKQQRLLARIEGGEVLLCVRCGEKPRYVGGRTVYAYYHDCYREQQREAAVRRGGWKVKSSRNSPRHS